MPCNVYIAKKVLMANETSLALFMQCKIVSCSIFLFYCLFYVSNVEVFIIFLLSCNTNNKR